MRKVGLHDLQVSTMIKRHALILILAISAGDPAFAISNGLAVSDDDPIQAVTVSVYGDNDDCTGVKVAPAFVLTARHCIIDNTTRIAFRNGALYKVIGRFSPAPTPAKITADRDLALLKIDGLVPGPVAELADDAATPLNGSVAWISGLGGRPITQKRNPLRKLVVTISNRNYSSFVIAIKAAHGGAVCDGDSGGPGYTEQNGRIVIWGIDNGSLRGNSKCASNEAYFKVSSEYNWIRRIIAGPLSGPR